MGILKGIKKGAKALGKAVDPAHAAARAVDKTVDTFKDDQFHIRGSVESEITLFGFAVGSMRHSVDLVTSVADKEPQ